MRPYLRRFCFVLVLVLLGTVSTAAAQVRYVGIPSASFNYSYASQSNSQWCWAAAIQMVLNYYGIDINQEQIVRRSYGSDAFGRLPDWPGSWQTITANLNNWSVDNRGRRYTVAAAFYWGAPPPAVLLDEMENQRPMIIAYQSSPSSGHAVVATAASYTPSFGGPIVQSIIVRDPWPSFQNRQTNGRNEYPGIALASRMTAYWIIRVSADTR